MSALKAAQVVADMAIPVASDVWPQQPAPEDAPWRKMQYKGDQTKGGNGVSNVRLARKAWTTLTFTLPGLP